MVEQTWLPVDPDPSRIVQRDLAVALTDVSDAGELLITVRAPSHLLRHPNKVVWFEPDPLDQPASSDRATSIDQAALADARRVFSTSARAGELLRRIAGIETPILAPERLGSDPDGVLVALLG